MWKKNPKNKQTKFAIIWGENSKLIRGVPTPPPPPKKNKKQKKKNKHTHKVANVEDKHKVWW